MRLISIPLAIIILALSLGGAYFLLTPPMCWSQEVRNPDEGPDFLAYRARSYSVMGPMPIYSYSPSKIVLYSSPKNIPVSLEHKRVSIKDWYSQPSRASELKKGKRVYVVRKGKEVLIFLNKDQKPNQEKTEKVQAKDNAKSGGR